MLVAPGGIGLPATLARRDRNLFLAYCELKEETKAEGEDLAPPFDD